MYFIIVGLVLETVVQFKSAINQKLDKSNKYYWCFPIVLMLIGIVKVVV